MPDKILPTREVFEEVEKWNTDALVYKRMTGESQALDIYMSLGKAAEGLAKIDHLSVAAAMGQYVVELYTQMAYAGVSPNEFNCIFLVSKPDRQQYSANYLYHQLMCATTRLVSNVSQFNGPAGNDLIRGLMIGQLNETLCLLRSLASRCGIYPDRIIVNAGKVYCSRPGKLNEFGQLSMQPTAFDEEVNKLMEAVEKKMTDTVSVAYGLNAEVLIGSPVNVEGRIEPSGWTLSTYIRSHLSIELKKLTDNFPQGAWLSTDILAVQVAELVDRTMERFVATSPKWKSLLDNRLPGIAVGIKGNKLQLTYNSHLLFVLDTMAKDQPR